LDLIYKPSASPGLKQKGIKMDHIRTSLISLYNRVSEIETEMKELRKEIDYVIADIDRELIGENHD